MQAFIANVSAQVETAAAFSLQELRGMVNGIADGTMPIPPPKPAPAPVAVAEPAPPTLTVFMIRSAHFRDHDGRKRFAGQFEDAAMPVATAQKAMRLNLAVSTADPRRASLRGVRGGDFRPNAPDVVDIDAAEEHSGIPFVGPDPVVRSANFQVIDRSSEARVISIPAGRAG
jgi:hypothetical protein